MNEETIIALISKGVKDGLDKFFKFFAWVILIIMVVCFLYNLTDFGKDSTDSPNERSNMVIRTDYKTGCEYLESGSGGLTPRLNVNSQQLGCLSK